jgi:DNA-binding CsgD family transcriptional regulator
VVFDGTGLQARSGIPQLGEARGRRSVLNCPHCTAGFAFKAERTGKEIVPMNRAKRSRGLVNVSLLQRAWNLTPAEARSASGLALGQSARDIALAHALSIHTVRTQLKRAMFKAGVHSQSALVASAYSLIR